MTREVVIVASRLERHAWTHGALTARLTAGLGARGWSVTLLCDTAEDVEMFGCRVRARRPFEHNQAEQPGATARWLKRMCEAFSHEGEKSAVTLSLTRLATGQVWMPLDESVAALLADELSSRGLASRWMWLSRHRGALLGRAVERQAVRTAGGSARVLAFGPAAAAAARERWPRLAEGVRDVGFATMVEPVAADLHARFRAEVRARLHINPARRVVLVSLMRTVGTDWEAFLEAISRITAPEVATGHAPVVVAMARDAYAVHDAACRAGCQRALRVVGQTEAVEALLSAADAVCAPLEPRPDAFCAGATGRFVADALRAGLPVLAAAGASGADLLRERGVESPGLLVEPTAEAWEEALRQACDGEWLTARAVGARIAGAEVAFDRWVERVEAELTAVRTGAGSGGVGSISARL